MKIIIITQDEPFYLAKNITYLYNLISKDIEIKGIVLYEPNPFGRKESFLRKALKTLNVFGYKFFIFYSLRYILSKFNSELNVSKTLKNLGLKVIKLNKSINHSESLKIISSYKPDLLVSILGTEIFKKDLLNLAPYGCINLHTSLLPKYRGLMPSFWVLKNNEAYSGVSVFLVDEGIDSGPIIAQKKIYLKNLNQRDLIVISKKIGMELIAKSIYKIKNNKVSYIENSDNKKSYYKFPTKKDVKEFLKSGKNFF